MRETLQQREAAMRVVLRKIEEKKDFNSFSREEMRLAKECQDSGLFEGAVLEEMSSGRVVAECRHDTRLTLKGIQFLQAEEEQSREAAKNEAERKQERKYQILLTLVSGLGGSLLTLFLEHISEIIVFISQLLRK